MMVTIYHLLIKSMRKQNSKTISRGATKTYFHWGEVKEQNTTNTSMMVNRPLYLVKACIDHEGAVENPCMNNSKLKKVKIKARNDNQS